MSDRVVISSPAAAPAIGPYSPGLKVGNLLFLSGQIPLDPASGQIVEGDIRAQTTRVLQNMGELLKAGVVQSSKFKVQSEEKKLNVE